MRIHVKIQIVSFICLRAIKTKHSSQRVPIVGTVDYNIVLFRLDFWKLESCLKHKQNWGS